MQDSVNHMINNGIPKGTGLNIAGGGLSPLIGQGPAVPTAGTVGQGLVSVMDVEPTVPHQEPVTPPLWRGNGSSVEAPADSDFAAPLSTVMAGLGGVACVIAPLALVSSPKALLAMSAAVGVGALLGVMGGNGGDEFERQAGLSPAERTAAETLTMQITTGQGIDMMNLAQEAVASPIAVGALYDAWKKNGFDAARVALSNLEQSTHKESAKVDPRHVFALSFIWEARRAEGLDLEEFEALSDLELTTHIGEAQSDPYSVFALTHAQEAGSRIAEEALRRHVSEQKHAEMAETDPLAVFALEHLDNAENANARPAMQRLKIARLAEKATKDPRVIPALGVLLKVENPEALGALLKLVDQDRAALDALLDAAAVCPEQKQKIVNALLGEIRRGSEGVAGALADAAKKNDIAVDILKLVAQGGDNDAAAALARAGEENPYALIALNEIYRNDMYEARRVMGHLYCDTLAELARSSDRQTSDRAIYALHVIGRLGNGGALSVLLELADKNPRAMIGPRIYWRGVRDPEKLRRIREAAFPETLFSELQMANDEKHNVMEVVSDFAWLGCKSAFKALLKAAEFSLLAIWKLDVLRFGSMGIGDVSDAMAKLDVSRYRSVANTSPQVILALQLLVMQGNSEALDILKSVDARHLVHHAPQDDEDALFNAVGILVRMDNKNGALEVLFENAPTSESALRNLQSLNVDEQKRDRTLIKVWNAVDQYGDRIRNWFFQAAKREDDFGEKTRLWLDRRKKRHGAEADKNGRSG